jgi:hypothetical protein
VRYLDFDKLACFPDGLTGKAFGGSQVKRLGIEKMFDALSAAGLRLRIEEDPEQTAKMQARIAANFEPRQAKQARQGNDSNMSNEAISRVLNYLVNKRGGLTRLNAAVKLLEGRGRIFEKDPIRLSPNSTGAEFAAVVRTLPEAKQQMIEAAVDRLLQERDQ